jgi:AraC family transcriptional regulator of adaptative response / DNA-3-methyladenine glycosylase II
VLSDRAVDAQALYRAVEGRDPRFAGRVFIAVKTTRIYCRFGCPAKTPKPENVQFFPSAAAARAAGFRACLRCRPDAAPGSATLSGTGAVLSRALRLLEESGSATGLAERLGISPRHLRRLFAQHLGASPLEVLRTRRLELARQLVSDSQLPMTEVALAAGFRSVRRFNEAMRGAFGRTPSQLRASRARAAELSLRLPFHAPLDFEALLGFLAPRALSGIEEVQGGVWRRTVREGFIEVSRDAQGDALLVRLPVSLARQALQIAARVSRVFDLRSDPRVIVKHLARDTRLRPFLRPGVRVPGAWEPFEMAVRAILGQQITVRAARGLAERMVLDYGEALPHGRLFPTPEKLASVELRGMPGARANSVRALAQAVASGKLRLDGSHGVEQLREVPGIGDWTAQLIAQRALGEPDAFPAADLGLCKALSLTPRELLAHAESWRPWRATAAAALWLYQGDDDATNG